jgi:hypothetical protein
LDRLTALSNKVIGRRSLIGHTLQYGMALWSFHGPSEAARFQYDLLSRFRRPPISGRGRGAARQQLSWNQLRLHLVGNRPPT